MQSGSHWLTGGFPSTCHTLFISIVKNIQIFIEIYYSILQKSPATWQLLLVIGGEICADLFI